jgi:regulatory protein
VIRNQPGKARASGTARDKALRALARREYGVEELKRKLSASGFDPKEVEETVRDLAGRGMVSDQRFTEALARNRRERGYGPLRVRHELRQRGVAEEEFSALVNEDDPAWVEKMETLRRRRFGVALPKTYQEWARQARFLQGRGYSGEQIRRALKRGSEE